MSTMQFFQSSNRFARNIFETHGMMPVDIAIRDTPAIENSLKREHIADSDPISEYNIEHMSTAFTDQTEDHYAREVFSLRNQVFAERLKWQVVSLSGMEVDRYDLMNPWYITIENSAKKVIGTWRAISTTGSYMLRDIFPELARGEEIPCDPYVWEISRFSVEELAKKNGGLNGDKGVAALTLDLLNTFRTFSEEHGVKAFVAVTSCAAERIMKKLGFKTRRMGDGKPMMIGKVLSTAIWIDCDDLPSRRLN